MASPYRLAGVFVPLFFSSVVKAISLQRSGVQSKLSSSRDCPSLFVAVLSTLDNVQRRNEIRSMWTSAASTYGNHLTYRYALCTNGSISKALEHEQNKYGDILYMDCEEGYLNGTLTRKVAESMQIYLKTFSQYELYMKIDDDAFLSTDRLCSFMDEKKKNGTDVKTAYFGVFAEGAEKVHAKHAVIRNETNPWFEPYDKYPFENYPVSAKGGPGYILPRSSIKEIIVDGIAEKFELNNEDKAVGYWVTKLKKAKIKSYVNIPGTDGYEEHSEYNYRHNATRGTFGGYPLIVHHHLEGSQIACLHQVESSNDANATIDACFHLNLVGIPKEHVRIHMPY